MKNKLLMTAAFAVAAAVTSQAALIAHYEFDGDYSATVGTDATADVAASIDVTTVKVGSGSVAFDGSAAENTTYGGVVGGDTLTWADDRRTVAFWMKAGTQTAASPTMVGLGDEGGNFRRFDARISGGNLRLELQGTGSTTSVNVSDGAWYFVGIVVPLATSTIGDTLYYVHNADGSLKATGNFGGTAGLITGDGEVTIGDSKHGDRHFVGNIDDVRIYNSALDATQIAALAAIPEPATLGMVALFGGAILFIRRKLMV